MNQQVNQLGIIPQSGFMRLNPVLQVIPVSKTAWYEGIAAGIYPAPVKLGKRSSAWKVEDIKELVSKLGEK